MTFFISLSSVYFKKIIAYWGKYDIVNFMVVGREKKIDINNFLNELRKDKKARDELVVILGNGVATKADITQVRKDIVELRGDVAEIRRDIVEINKRLDKHSEIIEGLLLAVKNQGEKIEEQGKRIEELALRIEEQGKRIEEQGKRIGELVLRIEEQGKRIGELALRIEEQGKRIEEQGRRIEEAFLHIDAMGARWGFKSESSFRDGIRRILVPRFGAKVEKWVSFDNDGVVFGHPSSIELDVVIHDSSTLLIEIKSHTSIADVSIFKRKGDFYEKITGQKVEMLIISPSVEESAYSLARTFGIEISTHMGG